MLRFLPLVALLGMISFPAFTQEKTAPTEFPARKVTLNVQDENLEMVLNQLQKMTGVPLHDQRTFRSAPPITLALKNATLWEALHQVGKQVPAWVSPYAVDGGLALVDDRDGRPAASLHGPFRTSVKQVTLSRNFEAGRSTCQVQLDLTWEPGLEPLLIGVESFTATFAQGANGQALDQVQSRGDGLRSVSGLRGTEFELRLPAPPRGVPAIKALSGVFSVIGPVGMFDANFAKLADNQKRTRDGVEVLLQRFSVEEKSRWLVEMVVTQPPGMPAFESYQSWLANNRLRLFRKGSKEPADLEISERSASTSPDGTRAVIGYNILEKPGKVRLGDPTNWMLQYHAPLRIIEARVPFRFEKIELP